MEISLLTWNVHKENAQLRFKERLEYLVQCYDLNLFAFQEVRLDLLKNSRFFGYESASVENIAFAKRRFGLLSASSFPILDARHKSSRFREFYIATKKLALLTQHKIKGGGSLYLLNLHVINFVANSVFKRELRTFLELLFSLDAPIIVAGDFNTWNAKRIELFKELTNESGLMHCRVEKPHHVKSYNAHPLDHILYKGLRLERAFAIETPDISDHNPIVAHFTLERS